MPGEISLTCDAWQADNTDGYFAVTGHWIEVRTPGEWTLEHAVLRFAQMNCSHSGTHLGQMLYKIVNRLQIIDKVIILCIAFSCHFAHSLLEHRLDMSHVTTQVTTRQCFKNSRIATTSRLTKALISNVARSGMLPDFYWHCHTDFLIHLGVLRISST